MRSVVNQMEVELGPDTGAYKEICRLHLGILIDSITLHAAELSLRVGLHSGQVTAGVLRGDRARFQVC